MSCPQPASNSTNTESWYVRPQNPAKCHLTVFSSKTQCTQSLIHGNHIASSFLDLHW